MAYNPAKGGFNAGKQTVESDGLLGGLCAIELADRSMMPLFEPGTIFIVEKKIYEEIKDGDNVVYCGSDKLAQLRQIAIGQETITLKSLNPAMPDMVLILDQIKKCDRVIQTLLPHKGRKVKQAAS